ncbi:MAG: NAD(P)/FAD-dependent oxidoreductase [Alphaproteobacteria bacterium]
MTGYDVAVVGGGLHGLSAALHLARAGRRAVVLERSWPGRHASGATAAGVRTLRRDPAEIPLSLEAMAMWHRIEAIVGQDCGFHAHGQVCVGETPEEMVRLERRAAATRALGHDHEELVDAGELRRLVPAIAPHCLGALIARRDGAADPHRTLMAFRTSAEAAGVEIRHGSEVTAIAPIASGWRLETSTGAVEAGAVINAAGAWAARVAALVGETVPLGTKASMMIVTERVGPLLKPVVGSAGRPLSFKQTDAGTLLIGGGIQGRMDLDRGRAEPDMKALARGAVAAATLFPAVAGIRIVRVWAGIEAKTEDMLPVIGPSAVAPGIFHAFGFSGHGFQLVPVVGAALADLVVLGGTQRAIAPFAVDRFKPARAAA